MSTMSEAVLLTPKRLVSHSLFQGWGQTELKRLFTESDFLYFAPNELIFKRGDHNTGFYIIDEGQVQLQISSPGGVTKKIKNLKAADSFGDACMLMNTPHRVDALTLTKVRVLKIAKNLFFERLAQQPELMRNLISTLSERLYNVLGDVLTANLHSGTQRVICYLIGNAPLRNGIKITLNSPKAQIAASLNLTPEHFSRVLHDLSARHFIAVDGRQIVLLDVDGLCGYDR